MSKKIAELLKLINEIIDNISLNQEQSLVLQVIKGRFMSVKVTELEMLDSNLIDLFYDIVVEIDKQMKAYAAQISADAEQISILNNKISNSYNSYDNTKNLDK